MTHRIRSLLSRVYVTAEHEEFVHLHAAPNGRPFICKDPTCDPPQLSRVTRD